MDCPVFPCSLGDVITRMSGPSTKKNNYQQKYKDRLKYINAKIGLFLSNALFFDDGGESSLMPEIWDCGRIVQKKASFKGQA